MYTTPLLVSNVSVEKFPTLNACYIANDYLGSLVLFPSEPMPNILDVSFCPFVRALQFLDSDTIVVTYLGAVGVK